MPPSNNLLKTQFKHRVSYTIHPSIKFGITIDLRQTIWTDSINRSIEIFYWSYLFSGKNMHEQVELFNKMLLNNFHNFIPNKIILCDDEDLPWVNDEIKKSIKRKNWLFHFQRKSGNLDYASFNSITQMQLTH